MLSQNKSSLFFLSLFILICCVDPILIEGESNQPKVVIDGYFTTDAQFNIVRISSSASFTNNYPHVAFNASISGATVTVHNKSDGVVATFIETSPGTHQTNDVADVNSEYYLRVVLQNGTVYQSELQQALAPVPVNNLSFNITQETSIEESSGSFLELRSYFFNINVTTVDPLDEKNYFLWRSYGTFEYITLPLGDAPCNYCYCWAPRYPLMSYVTVMSDKDVEGGFLNKKVAAFKYDRNTSFLTKVYQFSITPEAYRFWNSVSVQQASVGTIFDPAPEQIKGNIFNKENGNEMVLGFFTTAGVSTKHILINRGKETQKLNIKESNLIVPEIGDCRLLYKDATHIKPAEFYE